MLMQESCLDKDTIKVNMEAIMGWGSCNLLRVFGSFRI
jgi:hypothetical protein